MYQFRKDPVTSRWVIVNVDHPKLDFRVESPEKSSRTCPFCPGNEAMTPSEIMSYGLRGGRGAQPWQVRVIPNKFPALRIEETPDKTGIGIYDRVGGYGAHEVIIENPEHGKEMADLSLEGMELLLRVYRERCQDLRKDPKLKYILIFKNYGAEAGASLEHPHSQLIALPIVPSRVLGEIHGAAEHHRWTDRCIYCDMLAQERADKKLTVLSDGGIVAMAPFAARFPFETWILPKEHSASFDRLSDEELRSLAKVLRSTLKRLKKILGDPAYNLMVHTLPTDSKENESFHWHIEIIPHLTQVAGFELGTGFYLNPTPPEIAAERMRAVTDEL